MVQCSGLSINDVVSGERQFYDLYWAEHQLLTPAMWQASYIARVNEFAHVIGCPALLSDEGNNLAGQLTFAARIYAPVYRAILTASHGALP